jgi:hypothetical protein
MNKIPTARGATLLGGARLFGVTARLLRCAITATLLLGLTTANAQEEDPSKKVEVRTPAQAAPQPAASLASPAAPDRSADSVATHLEAIDVAITKLADKISKPDHTAAYFGLLGVLVGGVVTFLTQLLVLANQRRLAREAATDAKALADAKAEQDRALAERRAVLDGRAAVVQWKLRQLAELYGPLYALLRQSHTLYRQMNAGLIRAKPTEFRLREDPQSHDLDKNIFEMHLHGEWVRFRTVLHLEHVYGKNFGIEDYFDEVVEIGSRMVKVVQEKAGYVRPDQPDLATVFGRYLAHFSVLERVHAHLRAKFKVETGGSPETAAVPAPMNVDKSAVFPWEIQELVDVGFGTIRSELAGWGAQA